MDLPSAKELKKLADACRKAGIRQFKGGGIEFTLTDDIPVSPYKQAKRAQEPQGEIETDELSPEALLMWSAQGGIPQALDQSETE